MEEETFVCEECGKTRDLDEARMIRGGGAICEDCADEYTSCEICEFYFPFFPAESVSTVCPHCEPNHRRCHVPKDQKTLATMPNDKEKTP